MKTPRILSVASLAGHDVFLRSPGLLYYMISDYIQGKVVVKTKSGLKSSFGTRTHESTCSSGGLSRGAEVKVGQDVPVCVGQAPTVDVPVCVGHAPAVERRDVYPGGDFEISVPGVPRTTTSEDAAVDAAESGRGWGPSLPGSERAEFHKGECTAAAGKLHEERTVGRTDTVVLHQQSVPRERPVPSPPPAHPSSAGVLSVLRTTPSPSCLTVVQKEQSAHATCWRPGNNLA